MIWDFVIHGFGEKFEKMESDKAMLSCLVFLNSCAKQFSFNVVTGNVLCLLG